MVTFLKTNENLAAMTKRVQQGATVIEQSGDKETFRGRGNKFLGKTGYAGTDITQLSRWVNDGTKTCVVFDYSTKLLKKGNDNIPFDVCYESHHK